MQRNWGQIRAAAGDPTVQQPPIGHIMKAGGGWGDETGPAGELQPPFGSSLWLVRIQRQFSPLCKKSQPPDRLRKIAFVGT
eukprot:scaffold7631_cov45-Cyclotella_meneghiniana.AAC.1